jgi:hypothetical protein
MSDIETKSCECGKKMIKRYFGMVLMTNPPQYPYDWWCGCGRTENAGRDVGQAPDTIQQQWERAQ